MVPGVTISQSGRAGDFTELYTRGGNANQTLLLYDGFKVNQQGGDFSYESLDPLAVDRIEVVRGPASSLYGTDAVTGAINLITKEGSCEPQFSTSAAGGTYGSTRETLDLQGQEKKFSYNVSSSYFHRTQAELVNSGFNIYNYATRFDYHIDEDNALKLIVRGADFSKGSYEDSATGYGTSVEKPNPDAHIHNADLLVGLEYDGHIAPIWSTNVKLGFYEITDRNTDDKPTPASNIEDPPFNVTPPTTTIARQQRPSFDWQNNITTLETCDIKDTVTAGLYVENEHSTETNTDSPEFKRTHTNVAEYFQNRLELFDRAFLTAGVRQEQNGDFGSFTTEHGDAAILVPESNTRIHGSAGNSFRAPSFFELFTPTFGNPNLKPEQNFAYDMGVEQDFLKRKIVLNATYFHNNFTDLVSFGLDSNKFSNISHAVSHGYELEADFHPLEQLSFETNATLMHTQDDQHLELERRPSRTLTGRVVVRPLKDFVPEKWDGLDISVEMINKSALEDLGPQPGNPFGRVHLPGFTKGDIAVSYKFYEHLRAFVRVANFTDRKYEEVRSFPADGSNTMAGVEFSWKW